MSTIERALEKSQQLDAEKRVIASADNHHSFDDTPTETPEPPSTPTDGQPQKDDSTDTSRNLTHDREQLYIDTDHLEQLGLVTPTENFTPIKEEYRYIKRPLLDNAFGANAAQLTHPNLVLVSSCYAGEGKTFTALNLALSMVAEHDRCVLLVDADVIKPSLSRKLNISDQALGLLDYLNGKAEVRDIIQSTSIPNFKVVSAGTRHHHATEMIASERMKQFMKELSSRYSDRIVIFDTSPLLGASETSVLAQMTGQALIVVEEGRTSQRQVERALSLLKPKMAIGLVLNKSRTRQKDYYGYYGASQR
ncbi:XrtA-associated tyrosine autokinase [Marinobacterium rhizophilum]|uniref:XrtA-associated tyrosine autokinase n=1 Tax=Marinobacterium rhizophilum TaxID=420402 RepID=UPI000367E4EB|nr:XrtA-associated tyrosine autokinase [Marinobacterium rhizophilum]